MHQHYQKILTQIFLINLERCQAILGGVTPTLAAKPPTLSSKAPTLAAKAPALAAKASTRTAKDRALAAKIPRHVNQPNKKYHPIRFSKTKKVVIL